MNNDTLVDEDLFIKHAYFYLLGKAIYLAKPNSRIFVKGRGLANEVNLDGKTVKLDYDDKIATLSLLNEQNQVLADVHYGSQIGKFQMRYHDPESKLLMPISVPDYAEFDPVKSKIITDSKSKIKFDAKLSFLMPNIIKDVSSWAPEFTAGFDSQC